MEPQPQKTFAKELLIFLAGTAAYVGEYWIDANLHPAHAIADGIHRKRVRHSRALMQRIRQSLYNFERQGYITQTRKGERVCIALTDKGRMRVLCTRLRTAPEHPQGTHTLVFFDIPEKHRVIRALFRRLLKESGFQQWQKSVWGNHRNVFSIIETFIRHHTIEEWVTVCTTGKILHAKEKKNDERRK